MFLLLKVGGMRGKLINLLFCGLWFNKLEGYPLTVINEYPEGVPRGPREHFLQGMMPRSLSILRSKGFYLPCVWESHGGVISGEKRVFPGNVIKTSGNVIKT